jgi:hypothetical protein
MPSEREFIRQMVATASERDLELLRKLGAADAKQEEPMVFVGGPDPMGIVGSKQTVCGCGAEIWLSPSTQKVLAERGDRPSQMMCIFCLARIVKEESDATEA